MADIVTPVPAGTKLGNDGGPGGALRSFVTLVSNAGEVLALATQVGQAALLAATNVIGTRRYGTPLARVAVGAAAVSSDAMPAATNEVLLHASVRCFVRVGGAATNAAIPLEAGEKFHLRVSAGDTVSVIRDTTDGFLNVVPVVA